jgi:ribosome biogenesis GTPase / thiamine phosphate phosphatase
VGAGPPAAASLRVVRGGALTHLTVTGRVPEELAPLTSQPLSKTPANANDSREAAGAPPSSQPGEPGQDLLDGLIVDGSRGQYRVETAAGALICTIRGRLRKQLEYPTSASGSKSVRKVTVKPHDPVAVGDRVRVLATGGGTGVIEAVTARVGGAFSRDDPDPAGGRLTSVAGIEQVIAVFAARDPEPHLRMLDRFLVLAESQSLAAIIVLNKVDLGVEPWLAERLRVYRAAGYPVIEASAELGLGVEDLRARLAGRVSALMGPSGVGKSSLLNALEPELGLRVSAIGATTHKGRHTTTGTRLIPLAGPRGGAIADTAGIRALALDDAARGTLDRCFPEFRPYLGACRFATCAHLAEPGCAVKAAVAAGRIHRERYTSYARMANHWSDVTLADWERGEEEPLPQPLP